MSMQVCCDPAVLTTHSFRMLYEESHTMIYNIAYSVLKNEHDAWDVTQNVYIKVLMKADTLREPEKIRSWMVAMTYNECRNMLKAQRRTLFRLHRDADISEMECCTNIKSTELGPIDTMEAGEMRDELLTFLNQLPEEQRNTLFLYYYEQRSIDEIAVLTGCSTNTVKSRLNYGKKKMRRLINDYENKYHVTLRCSVLLPILGGIWQIKNATIVATSIAAAAACVISTHVLPANTQTQIIPEPQISYTASVRQTTATTAAAAESTTTQTSCTTAAKQTSTTSIAAALAMTTETTTYVTTTTATTTTSDRVSTIVTTTEPYTDRWEYDDRDDCYWDDDGFCWWEDNCWWNGDHCWDSGCGDHEEDERNDPGEDGASDDATDPTEENPEEELVLPDGNFQFYLGGHQRPGFDDRWNWNDWCDNTEHEPKSETESDYDLNESIEQLEEDAENLIS